MQVLQALVLLVVARDAEASSARQSHYLVVMDTSSRCGTLRVRRRLLLPPLYSLQASELSDRQTDRQNCTFTTFTYSGARRKDTTRCARTLPAAGAGREGPRDASLSLGAPRRPRRRDRQTDRQTQRDTKDTPGATVAAARLADPHTVPLHEISHRRHRQITPRLARHHARALPTPAHTTGATHHELHRTRQTWGQMVTRCSFCQCCSRSELL